jgi:hypothetical protein
MGGRLRLESVATLVWNTQFLEKHVQILIFPEKKGAPDHLNYKYQMLAIAPYQYEQNQIIS